MAFHGVIAQLCHLRTKSDREWCELTAADPDKITAGQLNFFHTLVIDWPKAGANIFICRRSDPLRWRLLRGGTG